jgi:DNA-binding GntR family transcriptional regulator
VRSALGHLAGEGLVILEPHRGASVAALEPERLREVFELRTALEVESARLGLQRDREGFLAELTAAAEHLAQLCRRPRTPYKRITEAHAALHDVIAAAAGNRRMRAAHQALAGELRLFMLHLEPVWTREELASHHLALPGQIAAEGEEAVRRHLDDGRKAVLRE